MCQPISNFADNQLENLSRHQFQVMYTWTSVPIPLTMITGLRTRLAHTIALCSTPSCHEEKRSREIRDGITFEFCHIYLISWNIWYFTYSQNEIINYTVTKLKFIEMLTTTTWFHYYHIRQLWNLLPVWGACQYWQFELRSTRSGLQEQPLSKNSHEVSSWEVNQVHHTQRR